MTSNFFTEAVFKIERFYYSSPFFEPDVFFRSVPGWSFDLHLALCYLTIALSLCCLLYKTIVASSLYKIKYISVILQVAIIVIINGFYVFFELPVDFSVLFYSVFSASFYYFSFNYIPSLLRRFTVHHVIQEMNNGIAIFDDRGQCIYANDYVREIYRIKPHQNPNDIIQPVIKRITNGRSLEFFWPTSST